VQTIINLLNQVRNEVVAALNQDSKEEADRQNEWQARQDALNGEFYEFQRAVNESTVQIAALNGSPPNIIM
jgi:hypothetical protein